MSSRLHRVRNQNVPINEDDVAHEVPRDSRGFLRRIAEWKAVRALVCAPRCTAYPQVGLRVTTISRPAMRLTATFSADRKTKRHRGKRGQVVAHSAPFTRLCGGPRAVLRWPPRRPG